MHSATEQSGVKVIATGCATSVLSWQPQTQQHRQVMFYCFCARDFFSVGKVDLKC